MTRVHLFLLAVNVVGCAIQTPLTQGAAANLKGRALATTARRRAPFLPRAPAVASGALAALVSEAGPADEGEIILHENEIVDPALAISRQLSDDLERSYGLRRAPRAIAFNEDDPTKLPVVAPSADLVIDVWTSDWSLKVILDDPSKYRVHYAANFRLIDAKALRAIDGKAGRVIAEGSCESSEETLPDTATRDEFLAKGARRLKGELGQAVQLCVEEFRSKVLHPN
jgi:hypothetical protein